MLGGRLTSNGSEIIMGTLAGLLESSVEIRSELNEAGTLHKVLFHS